MPRKKTQAEWDQVASDCNFKWLEPVRGSHTPHQAQCLSCQYRWSPYPVNSSTKATGCPRCGSERGAKKQKLDPKEHQERAEKMNVRWLQIPTANSSKTEAECMICKHQWLIMPRNLYSGFGCPRCGDQAMASKQRASQEQRNQEAAAVGVKWLEPVLSWKKKTKAQCLTCGYIWRVRANGIQRGNGCPECAISGYKTEYPGLLYLLKHPNGYCKIGITNIHSNKKDDRIKKLERQGYEPRQGWQFDDGKDALLVEQSVLAWIRNDLGVPAAKESGDGYTETISTSDLSLEELAELIQTTVEVT